MANIETNRIENKEKLNEDFEQEVIAFLNYREGGIIYVGIRKDGQVVGVKDIDLTQLQICLLYTSPSPRDKRQSRMPSSA